MAVYMDYTPRKIIAMIKSGFKDEALRSFTIWFPSEGIIRKGKMIIKEVGKEH
jgi:hypothetical protein